MELNEDATNVSQGQKQLLCITRVMLCLPPMLILDEAVGACSLGFIKEERLLELIGVKPEKLEVILTGRNPSKELLAAADYVTEMVMRAHPYTRGIPARKGIEY